MAPMRAWLLAPGVPEDDDDVVDDEGEDEADDPDAADEAPPAGVCLPPHAAARTTTNVSKVFMCTASHTPSRDVNRGRILACSCS